MANITPTNIMPKKDVKQHGGTVKGINPDDPNDTAFKLVTLFVLFCDAQTHLFFKNTTSATTPPLPNSIIISASILASGLEDLPSWIDPESCCHLLTHQKRKSLTEAHSYQLTGQVSNLYHAGHYKIVFKACTGLLQQLAEDDGKPHGTTSAKGTISIQKVEGHQSDKQAGVEFPK
jgi:hypothetical protein